MWNFQLEIKEGGPLGDAVSMDSVSDPQKKPFTVHATIQGDFAAPSAPSFLLLNFPCLTSQLCKPMTVSGLSREEAMLMLRVDGFNDQGGGCSGWRSCYPAFLTTQKGVGVSQITQILKPNSGR